MKSLHKIFPLTAAALPVMFLATPAWPQWGGGYSMHPWGMMGGMGWMGLIFNLAFWILLIIALILLIKWLLQSTKPPEKQDHTAQDSPSRALEILKERYAKGEIEREEFEQKKKDLSL
jgi:putative membrane protein